jgi:serine protease AprX
MDGLKNDNFNPDAKLKRKDLAKYLVMGGAVRQYRALDNELEPTLNTVPNGYQAFIESVSVVGGALKDSLRKQQPVMLSQNGEFAHNGRVSKVDLAYSLVQILGLESTAKAFDPKNDIKVNYNGQTIVLADQDSIADDMKGYVQLAIQLSLLNVHFDVTQGTYDLMPQLNASFGGDYKVTRAEYALTAGRLFGQYFE